MAIVRTMSGGAPKEVFLQLTPQFERQSGHQLNFSFAVMSALQDRLAKGERADLLVMPTNILDKYQKEGVVRAEGRAVLGLVSINAVVRKGSAKPDLSTVESVREALLGARKIVHATPGATPSGTHMGKLVGQLGIADALEGKVIHRPALEGGVEVVARGEADIGFYPKSEVINAEGLDLAGPLPAEIQLTTIYGAGITSASESSEAATAFVSFVCHPDHRAVWTRGGFDLA